MTPASLLLAVVVVVLVPSGDRDAVPIDALRGAAGQVLGADASVVVEEVAALPDAASLGPMARERRSNAVVALRWDAARVRVEIVAHPAGGASVSRTLAFSRVDTPQERGRALGFAIASMLPEQRGQPVAEPGKTPPETAPAPVPPAPSALSSTLSVPPRSAERGVAVAAAASSSTPWRARLAIDALAMGAVGVSGPAEGVGGALAVRIPLVEGVALRGALAARAGDVDAANATSLVLSGAAGIAVKKRIAGPGGRAFFGARFDLLAQRHALRRSASDEGTSAQARWLPGAALLLEGELAVAPPLSMIVAAGGEVVLGASDVVVNGVTVAEVPPLRGVAELGVRVSF